eukprot:g693.t1
MPKKGGKKKKTPEQIEEEKRIAQEELEKKMEAEFLRKEEERKRLEEEERQYQEKLTTERRSEVNRLVAEDSEIHQRSNEFNTKSTQLKNAKEEQEMWDKYRTCDSLPDTESEPDMNTFLSVWGERNNSNLSQAIDDCQSCKTVIDRLEARLCSLIEDYNNEEKLDTVTKAHRVCSAMLERFQSAQLQKLDDATGHILRFSDSFFNTSNNAKSDNSITEASEAVGINYGMWCNKWQRPFRLKHVEFTKAGITVDIPKPIALRPVAVRAMWLPFLTVNSEHETEEMSPFGGVFHFDLLWLPESTKRVKKWTMRYENDESSVRKADYISEGEIAATQVAGYQFRVRLQLPSYCWFEEDKDKICWWDDKKQEWNPNGINFDQYDDAKKVLGFHTLHVKPIAILRKTFKFLPFNRWNLVPTGSNQIQFEVFCEAKLCLLISIGAGWIALKDVTQSDVISDSLEYLIDQKCQPGELLLALEKSGIRLCMDPVLQVPKSGKRADRIVNRKTFAVESALHADLAQIAPAYRITSSTWNSKAGKDACVVRLSEVVSQEDTFELESEKKEEVPAENYAEENEHFEWKTFLFKKDIKHEDLKEDITDIQRENPEDVKCYLIDCPEDGGSFSDSIISGEVSHSRLWPYTLGKSCSPDGHKAIEDNDKSDEGIKLQRTLKLFFDLVRPFSATS